MFVFISSFEFDALLMAAFYECKIIMQGQNMLLIFIIFG